MELTVVPVTEVELAAEVEAAFAVAGSGVKVRPGNSTPMNCLRGENEGRREDT